MSKRGLLRNLAEYVPAWLVLKSMEWLPLPAAERLAGMLASAAYRLTPRWKAAAERNLQLAFPEASREQRGEIVRGVYENLGRVLLTVGRMPRLNAENIAEWIGYEGFEHYQQALARGRGALFMTAHLGNWELSAFAHALFGNPMHVVVRPLDNPLLDRLLTRHRSSNGNRCIRKQGLGRPVLQALKNNEAVGILIDQNTAGEDGVFVDFFGRKARSTSGLARLAMRTGAAVIPGFALWQPARHRYVLRFYPPLEMVSSGDETEDLLTNTQRCQSFLEGVIRQHPDQWLWIHRRWKSRPPGEAPIY